MKHYETTNQLMPLLPPGFPCAIRRHPPVFHRAANAANGGGAKGLEEEHPFGWCNGNSMVLGINTTRALTDDS